MSVMAGCGFFAKLGKENFADNTDDALARAEKLNK